MGEVETYRWKFVMDYLFKHYRKVYDEVSLAYRKHIMQEGGIKKWKKKLGKK